MFVEETNATAEKVEEMSQMLSSLQKAKEMTVAELRTVMQSRDQVRRNKIFFKKDTK